MPSAVGCSWIRHVDVLEWIKAIGIGSLLGVLVGAWLTRRTQDLQFRRQLVAQRTENARKAYVECLRLAHQVATDLAINVRGDVEKQLTDELRHGVQTKLVQLADHEIELHSNGASDVARVFVDARNWAIAFAVTVDVKKYNDDEHGTSAKLQEITTSLRAELERAWAVWDDWQACQESLHKRRRRLRWRRRVTPQHRTIG